MRRALSGIVGVGRSIVARKPIGTARELAVAAVRDALADAGLKPDDVDGLLLNQSSLAPAGTLPLQIVDDLALSELALLHAIEGKGSSVVQMVQMATLAVNQGMASIVACVFADSPLAGDAPSGASYQSEAPMTGIAGWESAFGLRGPVTSHALLAQRYLHDWGLDASSLGAYAIACRRWASLNPRAFLRNPLTMDDYLASRPIAEPLRLLDCAYPVNGGAAVIVASQERASAFRQPSVYVHGLGQGHVTTPRLVGEDTGPTGGALAAGRAYRMAGIVASNVDVCQFYDAFSICAIHALEDFGLCSRGDAIALIASGDTSPGGRLPVNTGGGHLSDCYLQGMTPLLEAVTQARGHGGARQVSKNDILVVNGSGGLLEYHAALILSPHESIA